MKRALHEISSYIQIKKQIFLIEKKFQWKLFSPPDHEIPILMERLCSNTKVFSYHSFDFVIRIKATDGPKKELLVGDTEKGIDIGALRDLLTPSSFGKGGKTLIDENVRKCLEVPANLLDIKMSGNSDLSNFSPYGHEVSVIPKKLCVYPVGGHFDIHTDTVRANNHVGTLITQFPNKFTGGELMIKPAFSDDTSFEEIEFSDWHNTVAFYTDSPHKVLEVKSGERVMLQCDLFIEREKEGTGEIQEYNEMPGCTEEIYDIVDPLKGEIKDDEQEKGSCDEQENKAKVSLKLVEVLAQKLKILTENKELQDSNASIAVQLTHMYIEKISPEHLKGVDALLYQQMQKLLPSAKLQLKTFTLHTKSDDYLRGLICPFPREKRENQSPVYFIAAGSKSKMLLLHLKEYAEHTGNEASPEEYICYSCALVIPCSKN